MAKKVSPCNQSRFQGPLGAGTGFEPSGARLHPEIALRQTLQALRRTRYPAEPKQGSGIKKAPGVSRGLIWVREQDLNL
jgi:hypothetical protein